ncbi:MAG TPA: glucoamylase family protein, partial [Candidatus Angelobacter sp.]|nr:glucoamylase family protein [Candidatus Angelobacter sp.]
IDFRGTADDYLRGKGIDYFENSRRATLAQRAYCIANPGGFKGYGEMVWGLTACDGPGFGKFQAYSARGAPPPENDDGTIAPTAVGASMPFAPEICLPTLRHFYDAHRPNIWTRYGFCDAFNPTANWWDPEVLGIDQGPILIMIENYRTGKVWKTFMKAPEVQRGLKAAGFQSVTVERNNGQRQRK